MISIVNNSTDPYFNLALEEYAVKHLDPAEDYIILWQNRPSVIIGRNQNTMEEINYQYVKDNNINVVRRLSGGGAVYHDLGNLNFTFITGSNDKVRNNFKRFTEPVVKALKKFGVEAQFNSRNDIAIDGKKFSGNAQYYFKNRVLHHGTILFNSDLSAVQEVLKIRKDKIESKGIKSVRSRVTNIIGYLPQPVSMEQFKEQLLKYLLEDSQTQSETYILSNEELKEVKVLMEERYLTWEWNFGSSPAFNKAKSGRFHGGKVEVLLEVKKGQIVNCKIYGDFFGKKDISVLEELLKGIKYEEQAVRTVLNHIDMEDYTADITLDEFLSCVF